MHCFRLIAFVFIWLPETKHSIERKQEWPFGNNPDAAARCIITPIFQPTLGTRLKADLSENKNVSSLKSTKQSVVSGDQSDINPILYGL